MKQKKRIFLSLGLLFGLLFAMSVNSYAGYVDFDVTVASSGNHPDPLSPRMIKEDYENRFYVTPTWFSNSGEILGFSRTIDKTRTSYAAIMRSNALNVRVYNPYLGNSAPCGQACCLETYWGSSATTNTLNVIGRYTP